MHGDDHDLLQAYAQAGAQEAFAALVDRYVNLVFSAARRQVRGHDLAKEVTQLVFIALARKAHGIPRSTSVVAWLYVTTRRIAIDLLRSEARRQAREHAAMELAAMKSDSPEWPRLEPWLDEAMSHLNPTDGSALLLRFFENKSLREVGAALGISEDAAQKRVSRALDQLRAAFGRKGIAVTAAGLATQLSAHAVEIAPVGLGATVSTATFATATTGGTAAFATFKTIAMTTVQKYGLVATLALAAGVAWYEGNLIHRQRATVAAQREQAAAHRGELARLRADHEGAAVRLAAVEQAIDTGLGAAREPESSADAALRVQMESWLMRMDRLKRFMAEEPGQSIPELALVPAQNWFLAVNDRPLESEENLRTATARLRGSAQSFAAQEMVRALDGYLKANDGRLPDTPAQLQPYISARITPAMLDRYEMLQRGRFDDLPAEDRRRLIGPKEVADATYDQVNFVGRDSVGGGNAATYSFSQAMARFNRENSGRAPASAAELVPYLKWPLPPATLEQLFVTGRIRSPAGGAAANPAK